MRVVVALGGNALLRRGEAFDLDRQRGRAEAAARALAPLAADHELLITHGNGPQIGFLSRGVSALDPAQGRLDALGAESGGLIGYLVEQAIRNEAPGRPVATLVTQTLVDPKDEAFGRPTKPIGSELSREEAARLRDAFGWCFRERDGRWRRVVASPVPQGLLQLPAIEALLGAGVLPICVGGGGVPVYRDSQGRLRGAEAVVDKDLASALLARLVGADKLLLLTDVPAVYRHWGHPPRSPLARVSVEHLASLSFEAGSMAPKVAAACEFVGAGGEAAIGALEDAAALFRGERGTQIFRDAR